MSTISDILEDIAPWLATALTSGPAGIAALAVTKLSGILGSDSTVKAVSDALSATQLTADQKLAISTAENSFQLQMRQMGFTHEEQMVASDNDTLKIIAGTMQAELTSANWFASDWRPLFGYVAACSFGFTAFTVCTCLAYAVFFNHSEMLPQIPLIISAMVALFAIPNAVLGIAAYHDGKADREIATTLAGAK